MLRNNNNMLAGYIHRTLCKRVRLQDADKWTFYWHIHERILYMNSTTITWLCNKVRELIAIKVLHTSLLNTTVVAFKVLPLGSCALIPELSSPLKTILELVLWNGLQSCPCIIPDVINVIKMPSFQYFLYLRKQKKVTGG